MLLPMTLDTLGRRLGNALAHSAPRHAAVFGFFASGLPATMPALRTAAVHGHLAAATELILARWHREWSDHRFSCDHTHIPIEIKRAAAPGSKLRDLLSIE